MITPTKDKNFSSPNANTVKTDAVTVVLLLHGEPRNISKVIKCLKQQNLEYGAIEILFLDDGTSPKALDTIRKWNVTVFTMPKGCTISEAKNKGIALSNTEYVMFLDDHIYLESGSIDAAFTILSSKPEVVGVCGYYESANRTDYNILRDIKRHSIYGKNCKTDRIISKSRFTTFSTGIAVVRKSVFERLDFPMEYFPNDFGGEDVPALLSALHEGYVFWYTPKIYGVHDHNLTYSTFIKKMEIEIRGRFSLFYWLIKNPEIKAPYLHGFLNFPLFLSYSILLFAPLSAFSITYLLVPLFFLVVELTLSSKCLGSPDKVGFWKKLQASIYVLMSDLLSIVCFVQYILSEYRRPFPKLSISEILSFHRIFLNWEVQKFKPLK